MMIVMPSEPSSDVTFVAGEARADVFAAFGGLLYGGLLLLLDTEYSDAAWVIVAFGAYMLWRGIRSWGKPYVLLSGDRLVIFDRGRPKHYVPFDAIAAVQRGFNRTRLLMRDGVKLHVSHLGFLSKAEVEQFRTELLRRVHVAEA
jgi:hypothetical protein